MSALEKIRTWREDSFVLDLFDTGRTDRRGKSILGYVLYDAGDAIFAGEDFACSPLHAVDSDETVAALLGFLSLRAGDTDEEYFDGYTPEQIAWRDQRAEDLRLYVFELENRDQS